MSRVLEQSQERGPIVEVAVRPGMPVRTRVLRPVRTVRGWLGTTTTTAERHGVVTVAHSLPDEYVRDDCVEFVAALAQQIEVLAERENGRTHFRLTSHHVVFLDVTECNHLPTELVGVVRVDNGLESVDCLWTAWLNSLERIDEGHPSIAVRSIAGYTVGLRGAA